MNRLVTVVILIATATGLSGCVTQEASNAVKRVQAAERLLKEDDKKIEAALKKLNHATTRAPKQN